MNSSRPIPFPDDFLLSIYRDRTLAMLRRYGRAAIELGRLPSLLGREFFRARVTSYTVHTFEDAIIFAFDMERCLEELTLTERVVIARMIFQEYSQWETAKLMRCDVRTIRRIFPDAIDHLTEIMLERRLLNPSVLCPPYQQQCQSEVADEVNELSATTPTTTDTADVRESSAGVPAGYIGGVSPAEQPQKVVASIDQIKACQDAKNACFAASA